MGSSGSFLRKLRKRSGLLRSIAEAVALSLFHCRPEFLNPALIEVCRFVGLWVCGFVMVCGSVDGLSQETCWRPDSRNSSACHHHSAASV